MYKTLSDAVDTALALKPLVANANHCEVVIAPVFTAIKTVADRLEGSNIRVSGQDCSTETEEGAHTGEVLASMLKDVGARYVIVGHSERRQFYCETDVQVNRKTHAGLAAGLTVIICVGNHPTGDDSWAKVTQPSYGKEAVDRRSLELEDERLIKKVFAVRLSWGPRIIFTLNSLGVGPDHNQGISSRRISRREETAHWSTFGNAKQCSTFTANCIHYGLNIRHSLFECW